MSNIRELLEQAEDWFDIYTVLEEAKEEDIPVLAPMLPQFLKHREFLIRVTALELVGVFCLRRHMDRIEAMFEDKHDLVQTYALNVYYDLRGNRALPRLQEYCTHKTVRVRLVALCLVYVITRDVKVYYRITEIVIRKRGYYYFNQSAMIMTFENYLKTETYPEIIELYKKVLKILPKRLGVTKELKKRLKEMKT